MARTPSNEFPVGTQALDFNLVNTIDDRMVSLQDIRGTRGTVIYFICNHCPFVIHVNKELVQLAKDYRDKGIGFVAISSNDVENYPQDGPELMKKTAEENHYPFPYLYDETQEVAKAYRAACTPDLYVFDADLKAVYHGQLDGSRPGNEIPISGEDMRLALDRLLQNQPPLEIQKPSIGCNIKWKTF